MFVFLFLDLNIVTDEIFLILPYLKALKFGILFSVLKLYLRDLVTNM